METISITAVIASLVGVVVSVASLLVKYYVGLREVQLLNSAEFSLKYRDLAQTAERLTLLIKLQEKELGEAERRLLHQKVKQVIEVIESKDPDISYEIVGDTGDTSSATATKA